MARALPRSLAAFRLRPATSARTTGAVAPGTAGPDTAAGTDTAAGPDTAGGSHVSGGTAGSGPAGSSRAAGGSGASAAADARSGTAAVGKEEQAAAGPASGHPAPHRRRKAAAVVRRVVGTAVAFGFMVTFAVILARLTLEPSPASESLTHTNLRPGESLRAYLDRPELRDAAQQVGGNVLLGVPFGALVPVLGPRTGGLPRVLLLTAVVMLLVELAQGALITGRAFDVDDVILNTTGALLGHLLLGRRFRRAVHR